MTQLPRRLALAATLLLLVAGAAAAQPGAPLAGGTELSPAAPVIYDMETLRTGALPPEFLKQLGPLHSLPAIEDLLKANRIEFAWARKQVSSGTLPATFVSAIDALPPHEVFVVSQGDKGVLIGVVIAKR